MGFKTFGFAGGRADVWEPDQDVYWGRETKWLGGDIRYAQGSPGVEKAHGVLVKDDDSKVPAIARPRESARRRADGPDLRQPRRPGRQSRPDRRGARHPRDLRPHGDGRRGDRRADRRRPQLRQDARRRARPRTSARSPKPASSRRRASAGSNSFGTGKGGDTITSGLEVTWTTTPTKWSNNFFENLFGFEWELTKSPAGAQQWVAKGGAGAGTIPHAHDPSKRLPPTMLTTDLSLRFDPAYEKISRRFLDNPDQFADAFARAWFKLTHRDMGPRARYLGPEVPAEELIWQDPIPTVDHPLVDAAGHRGAQEEGAGVGPDGAAARLDRLGLGLDLPRLRQARRRQRRAHPPGAAEGLGGQPAGAAREGAEDARGHPRRVQRRAVGRQEDLARRPDRAGRQRRRRAGGEGRRPRRSTVPFTPGRMDASQEQTDVESFAAARARRRRLPQLPQGPLQRAGRGAADRQGAAADADRAGDDGARRRPARARRQRRRHASTACSPSGPAR